MKSLILLFVFLSLSTLAGVVKPTATYFQDVGEVSMFTWTPDHYPTPVDYEVLYYIPQSLKHARGAKALIYLHGGGSSTMTRSGSLRVASGYMNSDVRRLADDLGMVVIVPSAAGLNWGGHTFTMIRALARLSRKELDIDPNLLGLAGHSMGGMGITRNFYWLADEFAFIIPMAAGVVPAHMTPVNQEKVFNVPYVHLQGLHDHFTDFITKSEAQRELITELEMNIGKKSKFELIFYEGGHNPNYDLTRQTIARLQSSPRNLYQRELFGSLYVTDRVLTENGITFQQMPSDRYFWVRVKKHAVTDYERLDFRARASGNVINLTIPKVPENIRSLEILLSRKMFNFRKKIIIKVNGVVKKRYQPRRRVSLRPDPSDDRFIFEDAVELNLKQSFFSSKQMFRRNP